VRRVRVTDVSCGSKEVAQSVLAYLIQYRPYRSRSTHPLPSSPNRSNRLYGPAYVAREAPHPLLPRRPVSIPINSFSSHLSH
jgi:hypothetical protein